MQASITKYMTAPPKSSTKPNYSSLTASELKLLCKKNGIKGYSKLKKDELLKTLNNYSGTGLATCFELKNNDSTKTSKKGHKKILQHLLNSKQIILLQRIKTASSNVVLYHPTTTLVFNEVELKKNHVYIVTGYLTPELKVLPITKDLISVCKEWKFEYELPENISTIDPTREHKLEDDELDNILYKTGINDDEEDEFDEIIPNYDDLY
jgi:hypothetical protein